MSAPTLTPIEALRLMYDAAGLPVGPEYFDALDAAERTLEAYEVQS